jgi:hypothetical protein
LIAWLYFSRLDNQEALDKIKRKLSAGHKKLHSMPKIRRWPINAIIKPNNKPIKECEIILPISFEYCSKGIKKLAPK